MIFWYLNVGFCCRASQFVDLFPTVSPDDIVVREARLEDYWEVAETHCNTFFPEYSFPLDFVLRIDRLLVAMLAAMLSGLFRPSGCKRVCLVAVVIGSGISHDESVLFRSDFDGNLRINKKGYVAGILTLDNFADFLPRKRPRRQRRWVTPLLLVNMTIAFVFASRYVFDSIKLRNILILICIKFYLFLIYKNQTSVV